MWLLAVAAVSAVIGVALLWWGRSRVRGPVVGGLTTGGGVLLVAVATATTGLVIWAATATDESQFARALMWGASDVGDQDRFPSRPIRAGSQPVEFPIGDGSLLDDYRPDGAGQTLDDALASTGTTAFIVIHGDELLDERYYNGSSREATQTSFSVAKSFVATLVGIAVDEGFVSGLDAPVTDYVPELLARDERFADIELRHLITMSSGLAFRDGSSPWDDPANTYYGTDLRSSVITDTRIVTEPGTTFLYNDWNVILLGNALERATGMSIAEYTETRLWQPMGAEADGSWSLDSDASGFEKSFVGINARAIDFAKLGWLYLHDGYNGERSVVPPDFVEAATNVDAVGDPAAFYQYLWWVDEPRDAYYANGDHGQMIYVDPGADLVIVRHGREGGGVDWARFSGELTDWLAPRLADR